MSINYEKSSQVLKALAHPARLKMLEMLLENECCVNNIAHALNIPQSTSSQHLGILRNSGIIYPKKNGVTTCYRVKNNDVLKILAILESTSEK